MKAKSPFPRHARYADGRRWSLSQSQAHSVARAIPADANPRASCGAGRGYRNGWQDATMLLMNRFYEASTLDVLERERLTGALEGGERVPTIQTLCRAQKRRRPLIHLTHLLSDARLRRELFAEVTCRAVAEWAAANHRKFAEQFRAALPITTSKNVRETYARRAAAVIPP